MPTSFSPSRRTVLGGLSLLADAPLLAACGEASTADGSSAATGTGAGGAEPGAFPVTIEHKFGSTKLTTAPKRVVCVGLVEQDALLALGIVPVAVTDWFGKAPGRIFSWATADLGGGTVPTVLDATNGVPIERVAALEPDLIIGQYAGLKQKEYDLLSKIAPTVSQPKQYVDYGEPWDESTMTIAKAVGRPAAGKKLVDEVKAVIAKDADANAAFAGKTAAVVTPYEGLFVYGPEDPRGRILEQLGFSFPPKLLEGKSDEFGWSLSAERTTDLDDVDAVVWLDYDGAPKGMKALFEKTTAFKEGRYFSIGEADGDYYIGQSFVTPLSIPYVLERYVPQLAAAVDGDPATAVPKVTA